MSCIISIIIPFYNSEKYIKETLKSIQNQSFINFECILVDDGSTDSSNVIIQDFTRKDSRFKLFLRTENDPKGPSGCRNLGFRKSNGSYIQFFDSDDLMHPKHLEKKINAYLNQETDLVICQLIEFDNDDFSKKYGLNKIDDFENLLNHLNGTTDYYLPCPLWKRNVIANDLFPTQTKIYEDLIFNLINRKKCKKVTLLYEPLIYYRRHIDSTTGRVNANKNILQQKILAWNIIYEELKTDVNIHQLKSILFQNSYLNYYYLTLQKSIPLMFFQLKYLFLFSSKSEDYFNMIKLLIYTPITFIFLKGYSLYKLKSTHE